MLLPIFSSYYKFPSLRATRKAPNFCRNFEGFLTIVFRIPVAKPGQNFPNFGSFPKTRLLGFRILSSQISSEFSGFLKRLPGQISGNFGDLSESKKISKISCRVSPHPCFSLYLPIYFRVSVSICFVISIFLRLSLYISIYPNLFLFSICTSLSATLYLCLSLGLSRYVSV